MTDGSELELLDRVSSQEGVAIVTDAMTLEGWVRSGGEGEYTFVPTSETMAEVRNWHDGSDDLDEQGLVHTDGDTSVIEWIAYTPDLGTFVTPTIGEIITVERRTREQIGQR
jgi:hypothetical protein